MSISYRYNIPISPGTFYYLSLLQLKLKERVSGREREKIDLKQLLMKEKGMRDSPPAAPIARPGYFIFIV